MHQSSSNGVRLICHLLLAASALVMIQGPATCAARLIYPAYHVVQRKADPFVALTHTLRQQERQDQQQQQQQQQQMGMGNVGANEGHYYAPAAPMEMQPSQDDVYQFQQLQRELGRAAFMPFYGRAQRTAWGQVVPDEVVLDDERNLPAGEVMDEDDEYGYGVPVGGVVLDDGQSRPQQLFRQNPRVVEDDGQWYDDAVLQADYERNLEEQRRQTELLERQEQEKQEAQLLLDTLTEYMLMYGNGPSENQVAQPQDAVDDLRAELELEESKRAGHRQQQSPSTTPAVPTSAVATRRVGNVTPAPARHQQHPTVVPTSLMPMDKQPPVQHGANGDSLGQKEFPMMRPAIPQRPKWLDTFKVQQAPSAAQASGESSKRHHHSKTKTASSIVTSEDELIEELDNLKKKKN